MLYYLNFLLLKMEPRIYVTQPSEYVRNISQEKKHKFSIVERISQCSQNSHHFQQTITSFRSKNSIKSFLKISESQFPVSDNKKIRAGYFIYDCILNSEQNLVNQAEKGINTNFDNKPKLKLKLRIPQTIVFQSQHHTFIYFDQKEGIIKTRKNITFQDFYNLIESRTKNSKENPPFIMKMKKKDAQFQKEVILKNDANQKLIIKGREPEVLVRFIYPCNNTPNLMRVFFIPKQTKNSTKTHAISYSNKRKIDNSILQKTHKLLQNTLVNTQKGQSHYKHLIKGDSLKIYEQLCQSLVDFIQANQKVKIYEIVVDFITDYNKIPWFSQIKFIRSKKLVNIWGIDSSQQMIELRKQKSNILKCPVCELQYQKHQMKKIVTNKLINQLLAHLKLRGIHIDVLFPRMQKSLKLSHDGSSRVCELCYEIITVQHQLINIEHKYCKIINIKPNEIERIRTRSRVYVNQGQDSSFENEVRFRQMKQWRFMIYIQKVKDIPDQAFALNNCLTQLTVQFKGKPSRFNRLIHGDKIKSFKREQNSSKLASNASKFKQNLQPYKLKKGSKWLFKNLNQTQTSNYQDRSLKKPNPMRLATQTQQKIYEENSIPQASRQFQKRKQLNKSGSSYKLISVKDQQLFHRKNNKVSLAIKQVKIIQFYTKQYDISKFIQNGNINFVFQINSRNLVQNNSSATDSFIGTTPAVQKFINRTSSQRNNLEVYLFDNKKRLCSVQMTLGLVCDGQTAVYQQDLILMDSISDCYVYKSDRNPVIGTCKPLPDQWMELFTYQVPMKSEQVDEQVKQFLSLLTSPTIDQPSNILRQTSITPQ